MEVELGEVGGVAMADMAEVLLEEEEEEEGGLVMAAVVVAEAEAEAPSATIAVGWVIWQGIVIKVLAEVVEPAPEEVVGVTAVVVGMVAAGMVVAVGVGDVIIVEKKGI